MLTSPVLHLKTPFLKVETAALGQRGASRHLLMYHQVPSFSQGRFASTCTVTVKVRNMDPWPCMPPRMMAG
jgi:hypothetical protein